MRLTPTVVLFIYIEFVTNFSHFSLPLFLAFSSYVPRNPDKYTRECLLEQSINTWQISSQQRANKDVADPCVEPGEKSFRYRWKTRNAGRGSGSRKHRPQDGRIDVIYKSDSAESAGMLAI